MPISTYYCTQSDMEEIFSAAGVQAFSDHEEIGEADADNVQRAITRASEEINRYCLSYSAEALTTCSIVNDWCAWLALFYLCRFRGNPPPESLAAEAADIREQLKEIRSGIGVLPDIPKRADFRPSFSNVVVNRSRRAPLRVDRETSDKVQTALPQNTESPGVPFFG